MNRYKKSTWFVLALIFVLLSAVLAVGPSRYRSLVENKLLAAINSGPLRVTLENSKLQLTSLAASKLRIFIPKLWTELVFSSVYLELGTFSIFKLSPLLNLHAVFLNGDINGSIQRSLLSGSSQIKINARDLQIATLSQLEALGFSDGRLSLFSDKLLLGAPLPSGQLRISLQNMQHPNHTVIAGRLIGLPTDLVIPRITDLNINTNLDFKGSTLEIPSFDLISSLGKAAGNMSFQFSPQGQLASSSGNLELNLSSDGQTLFNLIRQFLEQAGRARSINPSLTAYRWTVKFEGGAKPRFEFRGLEG